MPDGSALVEWAGRHMGCCRKVARRVLALVELNRADEAEHEAQYLETGYLNNKNAQSASACVGDLREALDRYQRSWHEDFDPWWMSRPSVQRNIAERIAREKLLDDNPPTRIAREPATSYPSPRHMVDELLEQGCEQEEIVRRVTARGWGVEAWDSLFGTRRRFVSPDEYERVLEVYIETHDPSVVSSGGVDQALEGVGVTHSFECDNLLLPPPDRFVTSTFDIDWKAMETLAAFICHRKLNASPSLSREDFQPMLNEARIAVWEARKTFDPCGTAQFSTYASRAIMNHLIDYVHRENRIRGIGEITDIDLPDSSRDPALLYDGGYEELLAILRRTPNAELLIQYAMGVDDSELGNSATIRQRRKRASDKIVATIAARN